MTDVLLSREARLPDPAYLTAEQVAGMLQVSEKSVLRWAAADASMPVLRIGRTLRFERMALTAWLKSKSQGFGRPKSQRLTHAGGG